MSLSYKKADIVVVGAGMAGLTAAYQLQRKGYKVQVFDAAPQVGGRARTERVAGFILDHGFHLLYTAYPQFKNFIDFKRLNVRPVYSGALVRYDGDFHLLSHPGKQLRDLLSTIVASNATWMDKMKMMALFAEAANLNEKDLMVKEDVSALEFFKERGFSDKFINSFFKPFLASAFLDNELKTPSRLALFILKMFQKGMVGLPENGIASVPEQIASKLADGTVHLKSRVKRVTPTGIQLLKGDFITADRVLIATNPLALNELLPDYHTVPDSRHVTCLYFTTDVPPVAKPVVVLNGEDKGLVNNLCVVNLIQPTYAPEGQHLIALHVTKQHDLDDEELVDEVLKEMVSWFGLQVNSWEHLKTYHIKYALPDRDLLDAEHYAVRHSDHVVICGDHLSYGSMNAAICSGKEAASMLHRDLRKARKTHTVSH